MNENENLEKKLKEGFESIDLMPFEDKFEKISSQINTNASKALKHNLRTRKIVFQYLAVSACFVLVFFLGIFYNAFNHNVKTSEYGRFYFDEEIMLDVCEINELTAVDGLHLKINPLSIYAGVHVETQEKVYYILTEVQENPYREIKITIVLKKEYLVSNRNEYTNLFENLTVSDKTISYKKIKYLEPFYRYYASYEMDEISYYFEYKSIEEDDFSDFFTTLLI